MKKDPQKLDLGCGNNLRPGFTGVDFVGKPHTQADIVHNLFFNFPWPFKDGSIKEVFSSHVLEHLPHGDGYHDPFFEFFDELYRVLKKGGTATFVTPYYTSMRAFQDPTHMRFIGEASYLYVSKKWRDINKLHHYPVKCDFEVVGMHHALSEEFNGRSQEAVQHLMLHSWNVVSDLVIVLKKL